MRDASLKHYLTPPVLGLVVAAVATNLFVWRFAWRLFGLLPFPIALNSTGTVLVGLLAGPWAGGLTGLLTKLLLTFIYSGPMDAYGEFTIGVAAGVCAEIGLFKDLPKAFIAGFLIGAAEVAVGLGVSAVQFGVTDGGVGSLGARFSALVFYKIPGSILMALLAWVIARTVLVPWLEKFPCGRSLTHRNEAP